MCKDCSIEEDILIEKLNAGDKAIFAIQRVRELHKPYELTYAEETVCDVCYDQFGSFGANLAYPCPTIKALDGNHEQS